jgi:hypothetical protein
MEHSLKDPTLMRTMAAALVADVSELCRRMASLNRRAIRSEPDPDCYRTMVTAVPSRSAPGS